MNMIKMLLCGLLALLAFAMPGIPARPFGDGPTCVKTCDYSPVEATLAGTTLNILGRIDFSHNPKVR